MIVFQTVFTKTRGEPIWPTGFSLQSPGPASTLWTLRAGSLVFMEGCPVHCRTFSDFLGLYPQCPKVVAIKVVLDVAKCPLCLRSPPVWNHWSDPAHQIPGCRGQGIRREHPLAKETKSHQGREAPGPRARDPSRTQPPLYHTPPSTRRVAGNVSTGTLGRRMCSWLKTDRGKCDEGSQSSPRS